MSYFYNDYKEEYLTSINYPHSDLIVTQIAQNLQSKYNKPINPKLQSSLIGFLLGKNNFYQAPIVLEFDKSYYIKNIKIGFVQKKASVNLCNPPQAVELHAKLTNHNSYIYVGEMVSIISDNNCIANQAQFGFNYLQVENKCNGPVDAIKLVVKRFIYDINFKLNSGKINTKSLEGFNDCEISVSNIQI